MYRNIDPTKDKNDNGIPKSFVQPIAMGVEPKYVMAELMGKITGCRKERRLNAYV